MTSNTTIFYKKDDLDQDLVKSIDQLYHEYHHTKSILTEDLYSISNNSYHYIGRLLKSIPPKNQIDRIIKRFIFDGVYQAETLSANAGLIGFLFGINFSKELVKKSFHLKNEHEIKNEFDQCVEDLKKSVQKHYNTPTQNDLRKAIQRICEDDLTLSKTIEEAIHLSGLEGKIFIEDGHQNNYSVELKEGYSFKLKPFDYMLTNNYWERNQCKVLIVDGVIDQISEIDHLLSKCFETKQPMAVIAMGFSEEVVATMKANQEKDLLDVQPIRVESDLESLNLINDIAVVCNTTPVSSFQGNLISLTQYNDIPTVDKFRLNLQQATIENSISRYQVMNHVNFLLEKRYENNGYEDIQNIIDNRIRGLVCNSVVIHLPNVSKSANQTIRTKIDISLRECKTVLNNGKANLKHIIEDLNEDSELKKTFKGSLWFAYQNMDSREYSTLSEVLGPMLVGKNIIKALNSNGMIIKTS